MKPIVIVIALALAAAACPAVHADAARTRQAPAAPAQLPAGTPKAAASRDAAAEADGVPLLAFYYIWYDATTWNRAKVDYPQIGRYSSDDPQVMRQHIAWAKSAGIDGFIVSWKDTPANDRRLQLLADVARQEDFKLAMIYQGLDFDRHPLPVSRVAADFLTFRDMFASDPVFFRLSGKPLTIWSGTWAYSHADVARVTGPVRSSMLVLSSEKSLDGYQRLADVTDGDAYYWSSVNPATNGNYGPKLDAMSTAIHRNGQYWIAPVAPGFDARLVGGSKTVERRDGATLRSEYATAVASSPDALGLISWNEFSENSYVEPSQKYGNRYLSVLADLRNTPTVQPAAAADSSDPVSGNDQGLQGSMMSNLLLLGGFFVLLGCGLGLVRSVLRRRWPETALQSPFGVPNRPALPPGTGLYPVRGRHVLNAEPLLPAGVGTRGNLALDGDDPAKYRAGRHRDRGRATEDHVDHPPDRAVGPATGHAIDRSINQGAPEPPGHRSGIERPDQSDSPGTEGSAGPPHRQHPPSGWENVHVRH